ncbi:SpaA isopeptide-forming pilin-related protein [Bifidobacterium crudilactis]|uniref:SpaA isopeptide-forming pilin-related protein n=1 Tax=Bifidobacterium crudilactis TaxID=327277 RepID=UPI002F36040A
MRLPKGFSAVAAFGLSLSVLLVGVLVAMPVEEASADPVDYGPDGYFSALGEGAAGMPMRESGATAANARKVLFGKAGALDNAAATVGASSTADAQVNGRYLVLGKGLNTSKNRSPRNASDAAMGTSLTTPLAVGEALLWADDVMTSNFWFNSTGTVTNTFDRAGYESNVAKVSKALDSDEYYSPFERAQFGAAATLPGVCVKETGCSSGYSAPGVDGQSDSIGSYRVFPLSVGDMAEYFNASDGRFTAEWPKLYCSKGSDYCNGSTAGTWLRSAAWDRADLAFTTIYIGATGGTVVNDTTPLGLRPAVRLGLGSLLLSAHGGDQSQVLAAGDALRLTFVQSGKLLSLSSMPYIEQDGVGGQWVLKDVAGSSDLDAQTGLGWKLVDPDDASGTVVASGRTNQDVATGVDGNMVVPCETLTPNKDYDLFVWGQQDGSDTAGWSNRATEPVMGTIRADGSTCSLDVEVPSSAFGIELTGTTTGTLKAYRIGEYDETLFTQTGSLKSVRLSTPAGLGTVLNDAAETAGGNDVDVENPIGWVAAHWLGYPTDPGTDDVTSAFSPYAGNLQLFAKALADRVGADGDGVLDGVQGSLAGLDALPGSPVTLGVSGPGLYLIVDSSQDSGGSLPIIVGTKVFNEDVGDEGRYVDFADAGVKGKPRLGEASLKSMVTDVAKRIVNDAGMDGFDVGSEVEFEIALRVPDLSGFSSVSYAAYELAVSDVAEPGLTLPAASGVRVLMDVPSPDTDVTSQLPPSSITVSGQMLTVSGLKAVFAEDAGGHVANKAVLPVGSLMRIRYRAVLNAGASYSVPGGGGLGSNENTVTLTRSKSDGSPETKSATANVYTFKVDLVKVDKDEVSKRLGGAQFEVSRDGQVLKFLRLSDGVYRLDAAGGTAVVTHTDGTLSLLGVEARGLSFKETTAPSGYFKVSDFGVDIRPVWNEDATQVTKVTYATSGTNLAYVSKDGEQVVVLDPAWSLANLPYTGGVGILVLLIIGGLILAFAIRPYILSKRAERDANLV